MALIRIMIHGFVLSGVNIASIIVAFGVYRIIKSSHQLLVQVPVSVFLTMILFLIWLRITGSQSFRLISISSLKELAWTYLVSLAWGPVIFIPLHYYSQDIGKNLVSKECNDIPGAGKIALVVIIAKAVVFRNKTP